MIYITGNASNNSNKNNKNEKHPLPLSWKDKENFWNGKTYEKTRYLKPVSFPPTKRDSEESDWNENLYPHS